MLHFMSLIQIKLNTVYLKEDNSVNFQFYLMMFFMFGLKDKGSLFLVIELRTAFWKINILNTSCVRVFSRSNV